MSERLSERATHIKFLLECAAQIGGNYGELADAYAALESEAERLRGENERLDAAAERARDERNAALAQVEALRVALEQADRIVLTSGVVGDYDGAYDRLRDGDRNDPEYTLGYHPGGMDPGYTVVIALDADLFPAHRADTPVGGG